MKNLVKRVETGMAALLIGVLVVLGNGLVAKAAIDPNEPPDKVEIEVDYASDLLYNQYHDGELQKDLRAKIHKASGEWGYCIAMQKSSNSGTAQKINIKNYLPGDELVYACLAKMHIFEDNPKTKDLSKTEKYALTQCMIWWIQRDHILDGGWRQLVKNGSLTGAQQKKLFDDLEDQIKAEAPNYKGVGLAYRNIDVADDQEIGFIYYPELNKGKAQLKKVSSNPSVSDNNNCYSLKDAVYGVYSDENCTKKTGEFRTNENGESNVLEISPGKYWVKELTPPKGFDLNNTTKAVTVKAGEMATVSMEDTPGNDPLSIRLEKIDKDTNSTPAQGAASLVGAQFTVKYYDGFYTADNLPEEAKLSWVIETKETTYDDGSIHYIAGLSNEYKVSGDTFYNDNGKVILPYGTISVEETKAPAGYLLENSYLQSIDGGDKAEGIYVAQIRERDGAAHLTGGNVYTMSDSVIRGGVKIQKRDLQTGGVNPQGGATLEGAKFEIINMNQNAVVVEGKLYEPGMVVKTIITNEKGIAETADDCLPYGDYKISEVSPPEGYLNKGVLKRSFSIHEEGVIVALTDKENSMINLIKRGDLEFIKIEEKTHKRMVNIPFRITSKTTKESHVAVTDDNGYLSTESSINAHSSNTNANDAHTEDEAYEPSAGIWFGLNEDGENVEVDDELGALPYDTYLVEELRCKANEKHELVPEFEIKVSVDKRLIKLGTITDEVPEIPEEIEIHTTATGKEDGSKTVKADEKVTIVDTVTLKNLKVSNNYRLTGWQMLKEENTELTIDGNRVENTVEFTADTADKEVQVEFTINTSALGGSSLVTFEELYDMSEPEKPEKVAEHKDIGDEGQTILVSNNEIQIHTNAANKADGSKIIKADDRVTIVDTVTLEGLEIGKEYKLSGWQMVKAENAELKVDGNRVENDLTFTADAKDMEVQIEFTFNASALGGSDLVTFEELYDTTEPENPEKVAEHKDIEDEAQTVSIPDKSKTPDTDNPKVSSPVKTGDNVPLLLYGTVALVSLLAAIGIGIFLYRRRNNKN